MKHVELEQFLHAFALRGFVSVSWASLFLSYLYNLLPTFDPAGFSVVIAHLPCRVVCGHLKWQVMIVYMWYLHCVGFIKWQLSVILQHSASFVAILHTSLLPRDCCAVKLLLLSSLPWWSTIAFSAGLQDISQSTNFMCDGRLFHSLQKDLGNVYTFVLQWYGRKGA